LSEIPIVFVTAKMDIEDLARGFAAGAVDYITKPVKQLDMEVALRSPSIRAGYSMLDLGPCRVTGVARFFRMWMFSISTAMEKAMAK